MQKTMQRDAAVFRTGKTLQEGVDALGKTFATFADVRVADRSLIWNTDLIETIELDNLLGQATATIVSAENRKESRGARSSRVVGPCCLSIPFLTSHTPLESDDAGLSTCDWMVFVSGPDREPACNRHPCSHRAWHGGQCVSDQPVR